jgi:hypothetical protein
MEALVAGSARKPESHGRSATRKSQRGPVAADVKRIEDALRKRLGTDVRGRASRSARSVAG